VRIPHQGECREQLDRLFAAFGPQLAARSVAPPRLRHLDIAHSRSPAPASRSSSRSAPGTRKSTSTATDASTTITGGPAGDPRCELAAVREAAGHDYPTADIAQMLAEIERGYLGGDRLVTDAEVLQEILHRYHAIRRPDAIEPAFDALLGVVDEVYPIEQADVERAKALLLAPASLSARDAVHVAVMQRRELSPERARWCSPRAALPQEHRRS
jgi:predicted nucleic acid-binding protein